MLVLDILHTHGVTGATSQSIWAEQLGMYSVSVTNSNGCSSSDSTYLNLLDARINQVDTTLCSADTLDLAVEEYCGFMMQSVTTNNSHVVYNVSGDDRGGIAVTPTYVYVNGDSYCTRYTSDLTSTQNFSRRDGIFSDLSDGTGVYLLEHYV